MYSKVEQEIKKFEQAERTLMFGNKVEYEHKKDINGIHKTYVRVSPNRV